MLARAVVDAVQAVGGHAGGVYLRSGTEGLLLMAALTGVPGPLFRPWWRMHVNRPFPVAEAYRSGHSVYLPDAETAMTRFPQLMAGLPFPFASLYEPVSAGSERFGVLLVLRATTPGVPVGTADREGLRAASDRLAGELAALAAAGTPVVWDGAPLEVPPPVRAVGPREALDRLAQAVLSVDRQGRIGYANTSAETLLGLAEPKLRGQDLWEALPWLNHPAYEDYFRAVFLAGDPVHFPIRSGRHAPGDWLSVSLYPGPDGVTVTIGTAEPPPYSPASAVLPGAGLGSPADRAAALYRPVALAIALSEAVTARQVSAVVTDELLPAFGGRQLAIYLLNERHLHLAWETGFPKGFLDRFDGVALDVRLPGVETLTSGRPMFFESMEHLAAAYPGIPLDAHVGARAFLPLIASGRPVGSCILGFDAPRGFSPEERTVLTALAGLIAQALERAQRYDSEAALARGLQAGLLPHRLPVREHVATVGRYLPGSVGMDVGGDWYDVIETGPTTLALVIGDVQGHGVAAAATMGQLRSAVRAFALSGNTPDQVLGGTNRLLIDLDPGQFASCCYVLLDWESGTALAVRAGHPQPLLRHADGRTEVLDLPGGVVLGIDADAGYPVTELRMAPGAVLALYTDGLVEKPGTDIDVGVERLRVALAAARPAPLTEMADRLVSEAGDSADRPDDIALLLASRTDGADAVLSPRAATKQR
ncbi:MULTISPECIES: SpoIIE family protein phosphatase [unclassified Streptomyces]|uniref:SpoIIE family protein phosphatase n=1 Tax=unclassified Streptomyces TaxID=2593676 RepID=UPI001BEAD760|nr:MULTISPECIES: SpoIIE family protein phosphatase [unclassified Streptomyces]MBT2407999.1 SpoIIE family protein phosphatase [Streptomyces sp. ISL-21]MBT2459482.1 SpoIIE family protein phosphatase [Streptomyces sp. ISL-86]MBT2613343.1 SpoIIE family protein phosphatase [Streptomyces sp. ISL-87]